MSVAIRWISTGIVFAAAGAVAETPAEKFAALSKQFRPDSAWLRDAETDLERREGLEKYATYAPRFLALVEKHADDPIALKALRQAIQIVGSRDSGALQVWQMNEAEFPKGVTDGSAKRIVVLLLRDYLMSDALEPICDRMRYQYRLEVENALRGMLEKNPHRQVKGAACLALAQFLHDKLRMANLADDRPELRERYAAVFGANYLPELRHRRDSGLASEIEALFERAAVEFTDVKVRAGVVGEIAKLELYKIRKLSVGKPAPATEGVDQNGESFKLSDYRGKVVLLYFWSEF